MVVGRASSRPYALTRAFLPDKLRRSALTVASWDENLERRIAHLDAAVIHGAELQSTDYCGTECAIASIRKLQTIGGGVARDSPGRTMS